MIYFMFYTKRRSRKEGLLTKKKDTATLYKKIKKEHVLYRNSLCYFIHISLQRIVVYFLEFYVCIVKYVFKDV